MADASILIIGLSVVGAAWDVGRRFADKQASKEVRAEVKALRDALAVDKEDRGDIDELRGEVSQLGAKLTALGNTVETSKARQRAPWGARS